MSIAVDAAILNRQPRKEFFPAAAIGDAVAEEDNIAFFNGDVAVQIGTLLVMMPFNAFHGGTAEEKERQRDSEHDKKEWNYHAGIISSRHYIFANRFIGYGSRQ